MRTLSTLFAIVCLSVTNAHASDEPSCLGVKSLRLAHTRIAAATVIEAGQFTPPDARAGSAAPFKTLHRFCRVEGVIAPTADSHIEFEVWLPMGQWNGEYMGVGNGGSGGFINYAAANGPSLAGALRDGFAASSTDTGHRGDDDDFSFARGHREQRLDYHYRAMHETALAAKEVIQAFYGSGARYSYFTGCSDGGRQGLMEVQRYPADYDGVLVCGPAVHRTLSVAAWTWAAQAVAAEPGNDIPPDKLAIVHRAVIAACDALDGLQDGLVAEPMTCQFAPASLLCKGLGSERCLTQPQVVVLEKFYSGPANSKGTRIGSGFLPGAETDPAGILSCRTCKASARGRATAFLEGLFDARFRMDTFDCDRDFQALETSEEARLTNTTNPDLKPFKDRGGKLIVVHGWSDGVDPALLSVKYFDSVVAAMGSSTANQFFRLYMVPDVYHNVSRGPGPTAFPGPMLKALESWVENGLAPDAVIATNHKVDADLSSGVTRTRPLCPYPQVARYRGAGSIDDAANFACRLP